ncbi:MAG: NAD(P)H-hydrate dehydratase [Verrucomicrobiae bacterium]|nr:NAD(P)H-hydrate dehydratase [Verrucomicrobiae bacterium]
MSSPVLHVNEMRAWEESSWAAGILPGEVIARAGEKLAARLLEITAPTDRILLLAGKGNNGQDTLRMEPFLRGRRTVTHLRILDPSVDDGPLNSLLSAGVDWVVDGLFGIGLSRRLSPAWQRIIETLNASGAAIASVDVPSGLDAQTGLPMPMAVRARITLTLGAAKSGLLRPTAWEFCGRLEVLPDIGLIPADFKTDWRTSDRTDFREFSKPRPIAAHKGTFGHALLLAGSVGYHGAAVLAARSALGAGPGLVTVLTDPHTYIPVASQTVSAMVHPWGEHLPVVPSAIAAGPGLASPHLPEFCRAQVIRLWQNAPVPMIVDASALDWLPPGSPLSVAPRVLTPHPGEAARLLSLTPAEIQSDRPGALRLLSRRFGNAWVVLKGHQSLAGNGRSEIYFNLTGNPGLAQGGSGDVLTGFLLGMLAQPAFQADPLTTIRHALWHHGATADLLSLRQPRWTAQTLAESL